MATANTTTTGVMRQSPDPIQARIAPYTNRNSLILFGGGLLIVVNFLIPVPTSEQLSVLDLVLQAVGLLLLVLIASVSEEGGSFSLLFVLALWLGFLYAHRVGILNLAQFGEANPVNGTAQNPTSGSQHQHRGA